MKQIFITGVTGCIGHYILEQLFDQPNESFHIHCLVRNKEKCFQPFTTKKNITFHIGTLEDIEVHEPIIKQCHTIIHIATLWGDASSSYNTNLNKTKSLFLMTNPAILEKIIYFSTASILGKENTPVKVAGQLGTAYVRSKYFIYEMIQDLPIKDRILILYPTLVFGGNNHFPYSHISTGINSAKSYLNIIRFLKIDGGFHIIHSKDIAKIVCHLCFNPHKKNHYILGTKPITPNDAIRKLCKFHRKRIYFQIKITKRFVFWLSKWFKIKIHQWDRYCIEHPYMIYDTVMPSTFNLKDTYPTLEAVLADYQ